jgi:hypothetical protein
MKKLILLVLSLTFLSACTPAGTINFKSLQEGDIAGAMTVTLIDLYDDQLPNSPYNSNISFEGAAQITATYQYHLDSTPFYNGKVCVSELQSNDLPKVADDPRSSRFCFNDPNNAANLLEARTGEQGLATFIISSYKWIGLEGDSNSWASLSEVIEKEVTVQGEETKEELEAAEDVEEGREEIFDDSEEEEEEEEELREEEEVPETQEDEKTRPSNS